MSENKLPIRTEDELELRPVEGGVGEELQKYLVRGRQRFTTDGHQSRIVCNSQRLNGLVVINMYTKTGQIWLSIVVDKSDAATEWLAEFCAGWVEESDVNEGTVNLSSYPVSQFESLAIYIAEVVESLDIIGLMHDLEPQNQPDYVRRLVEEED